MNLWLRLIGVLAATRKGPRIALPDGVSRLPMRVWLNDLDLNFHMTNGRYLTLMDLGRLDMLARAGLLRPILRARWMPVVTGVTIRYRRSLAPFQKFHLETRLTGWDEHFLFLEQRFVIPDGPAAGEIAAQAEVRATFVERGEKPQKVPVARLFSTLGLDLSPEPSPPATAEDTDSPGQRAARAS
ncbi:acyl-CoA thioesterase [Segnochrobactraceae bacterium EtOH-i3]